MSFAGALAAVMLHAIVLLSLSYGASAGKVSRPMGQMADVPLPTANVRAVTALILIDPHALSSDSTHAILGSAANRLRLERIPLPRLVRLSSYMVARARIGGVEGRPKATSTVAVDGATQALLFGRYVSQIDARIQGLWTKPQSVPFGERFWRNAAPAMTGGVHGDEGSPIFRCRVEILQSRNGTVREVTLLDCDGNPEWQQSLVNAIDAASPLPAPPNGSVFARSLVLNFTSPGSRR